MKKVLILSAMVVGLVAVTAFPALAQSTGDPATEEGAGLLLAVGAALGAFLIAVGVFAPVCTKLVDTVRNAIDSNDTMPKVTWNVLTFVFGVAIALLLEFNVAVPLAEAFPGLARNADNLTGTLGQIVTGLGIGAVGSGWHEKFSEWSARSKSRAV